MRILRHLYVLSGFLVLFDVLSLLQASHFRGGTISWKSLGGTEVQFSYRMGWRHGQGPGCTESLKGEFVSDNGMAQNYWTCQTNNCGKTNLGNLSYFCTDANKAEDWEQGYNHFTHNFIGTGPFTIGYKDGNWIALSIQKGNGRWNVATTVDLRTRSDIGTPNSSPKSLSKPMYIVQMKCEVRIKLPVVDPDDDVVRCRWAQGRECMSVCDALPNAHLDEETCTFVFNTTVANQYKKYGLYAVAITIEDYPRIPMTLDGTTKKTPSDALSSVPVQFLVRVFPQKSSCDDGPRFIPSTPEENEVITVEEGDTAVVDLFTDNGNDTSAKADRISVSGPVGLKQSRVTLDDSRENTFTTNVTWQTTSSNLGNNIVCGSVTNDKSKSGEQRCFVIKVVPQGCKPSPCQNSGKCESNLGKYKCVCRPGFNGQNCEVNIDDCVPNPCPLGMLCEDAMNTHTCSRVVTISTTHITTTLVEEDTTGSVSTSDITTDHEPGTTDATSTMYITPEKGSCSVSYEDCNCTISPDRSTTNWMGRLSRMERDAVVFFWGFPVGLMLSLVTFFCLLKHCRCGIRKDVGNMKPRQICKRQ